jgi:hypothetical protein
MVLPAKVKLWTDHPPGLSAHGRNTWPTTIRPRRSAEALGIGGADPRGSPPRSRMWPSRRRSSSTVPGPISAGEARQDDRAARLHARDARHLGPLQRVPDLPRDACAADPARHGRGAPGGFRFKPPYPKPVSAHPKPHASPRISTRRSRWTARIWVLCTGRKTCLIKEDGTPCAHRQGVHMGCAR